jgi:ACS family hexuronate transporter-like MFS transporter
VKWLIVAFIALSTFLNYVDRQTLALLAGPIQLDLGIDDKGYAYLVTVFLLAYTGGNIVSGWFIDKVGARVALPVFVAWWSIANACSGLVHDVHLMALTRFALGLAEVGNFIAAPAIVREFFPPKQRALAIGIYTAAAMFGATASPPLITWINEISHWRAAFITMGAVGLMWSVVWVLFIWKSGKPVVADASVAEQEPADLQDVSTWARAITNRYVWGVALGTMLTYPVWYFYLFWFPKYLTDERGLSTLQMGKLAWVVYAAAGIGCLIGGGLSGLLVKAGLRPKLARLRIMGLVCIIAPVGTINAFEPSIAISLALASVVAFIHMFWQVNITALQTELFTRNGIGKVFAVSGLATGGTSMLSTWLIGQLVGAVSYKPMFIVMAVAYPCALLLVHFCMREAKKT